MCKWTLISAFAIHFIKRISDTFLGGEMPQSWRGFSQDDAYSLYAGCTDHCDFCKWGKLDYIISGCVFGFSLKKIKRTILLQDII